MLKCHIDCQPQETQHKTYWKRKQMLKTRLNSLESNIDIKKWQRLKHKKRSKREKLRKRNLRIIMAEGRYIKKIYTKN